MHNPVKTRINRVRQYCKDNAPQIVTAFAAVGSYFVLKDFLAEHRMEEANRERMDEFDRYTVSRCKRKGLDFEHYPGLGVFIFNDEDRKKFDQKD
jgi:hypothetical protein